MMPATVQIQQQLHPTKLYDVMWIGLRQRLFAYKVHSANTRHMNTNVTSTTAYGPGVQELLHPP